MTYNSTKPSHKHILFFSNFCNYSKDLISMITKKNLSKHFSFVCIENTKIQIPRFVDRVPTILSSDGQLIVDEHLNEFVETLWKQIFNEEDVAPFSLGGISDSYSFIDDAPIQDTQVFKNEYNNKFAYLSEDFHIEAPDEYALGNNSSNKDAAYERYMTDRENDDAMMKTMNKVI
jgi:hypothetical protein